MNSLNKEHYETKLPKIVFVIDNLNAGGAERVFRTLADEFDKKKFEITLLLFNYDEKAKKKYSLPNDINICVLKRNKKFVLPKLIKKINELSPDVVFSTLAPVNIVCVLSKLVIRDRNIKFVIRETTIKSISIYNTKPNPIIRSIYFWLIKKSYKYADSIVALSEGSKQDLVNNFGLSDDLIKVIYNPINVNNIKEKSKEEINDLLDNNRKKVICVGSLVKSKGHKYLIEAIDILKKDNIIIDLLILGEGELDNELRQDVALRGLEKQVYFMGFKSNPYKYIKKSDLFVLPALWEGFGNVIVESMACGVPVISSNCESGPREIITHNENGLLSSPQDSVDLAKNIKMVLNNHELYLKLKDNSYIRAMDFDSKIIVREYENHLLNVINYTRND